MTREETDTLRREVAAVVYAAMFQGRDPSPTYQECAEMAASAFSAANAFLAEDALHSAPPDTDDDIDPRAFDPQCTHGRKQSEPCADCEREVAAAAARRASAEKPGKKAKRARGR